MESGVVPCHLVGPGPGDPSGGSRYDPSGACCSPGPGGVGGREVGVWSFCTPAPFTDVTG